MVHMLSIIIIVFFLSLPSPTMKEENLEKNNNNKKKSVHWVKLRHKPGRWDAARLKWGRNSTVKQGQIMCSLEDGVLVNVPPSPSLARRGFNVHVIWAWLKLKWVQMRLNNSEKSNQDDQRIHIHVCTRAACYPCSHTQTCVWQGEAVCVHATPTAVALCFFLVPLITAQMQLVMI